MKLYAGYSNPAVVSPSLVTFLDGNPVWYHDDVLSERAYASHKIQYFPKQIPALRALLIIGTKAFWKSTDKGDVWDVRR